MNAICQLPSEPHGEQTVFRCEERPGNDVFVPLFSLWQERRGSRRWPERGEIQPRDMRSYLCYVQLFEVIEHHHDFRIRVLGSEFVKFMGYDPSGQLVSQLQDELVRGRTLAALRLVTDIGKPIRTAAAATLSTKVKFRSIEKIWLPLGSAQGVTHIISQVHRSGEI